MNKSLLVIITLTLFAVFLTHACDRSSSNLENAETSVIEAEKDLEITKSEIEAEVGIYRQEIAKDIRENNVDIADIKRKIQDEDAETRAAYDVRIANLESTNNDLKREIDNYSISSRDNWDGFKEDFTNSMDDLGNSLDDFFSRNTSSLN